MVLREKFNLRGRLGKGDKLRDGGAKHAEIQFYCGDRTGKDLDRSIFSYDIDCFYETAACY